MPMWHALSHVSLLLNTNILFTLFPLEIPRHPGEIQLSFYKIISMLLGNFIPI